MAKLPFQAGLWKCICGDYTTTSQNNHCAPAYQNQSNNAMKFDYEKVPGGPRKFYFIDHALQFYFRTVWKQESFQFKIPRPHGEQKTPIVLTMSDCTNIFGHVENPKHKLLLLIAYGAGLRRSEIIALRRTDIRFDGHKITVRHPRTTKTVKLCSLLHC
jgi:integrase